MRKPQTHPAYPNVRVNQLGDIFETQGRGWRKLNREFKKDGTTVRIWVGSKRIEKRVEELVCDTYHGTSDERVTIVHLDGDRYNCSPVNLQRS